MSALKNIRLGSFSQFQESSPRVVSFVPVPSVSPFLPLSPKCNASSWHNQLTPIDGYRHLYNSVGTIHLSTSIDVGADNGRNLGKPKRVERLADT